MELDNSYNQWIIISSLNDISNMKEELYDKLEFANKELEVIEPKNKWGYPSKVCEVCKGRGVVYVADGQDDVVGEICDCQK